MWASSLATSSMSTFAAAGVGEHLSLREIVKSTLGDHRPREARKHSISATVRCLFVLLLYQLTQGTRSPQACGKSKLKVLHRLLDTCCHCTQIDRPHVKLPAQVYIQSIIGNKKKNSNVSHATNVKSSADRAPDARTENRTLHRNSYTHASHPTHHYL